MVPGISKILELTNPFPAENLLLSNRQIVLSDKRRSYRRLPRIYKVSFPLTQRPRVVRARY